MASQTFGSRFTCSETLSDLVFMVHQFIEDILILLGLLSVIFLVVNILCVMSMLLSKRLFLVRDYFIPIEFSALAFSPLLYD